MDEDININASLWFMMYWSSGAGKAGDKGTAMDFAARIANKVTFTSAAGLPVSNLSERENQDKKCLE